ncbi:MAG: 4Fe-4S binding protein [Planctomycetota bacterium]|jgi:electron transport complex protein RnfB|nr:4Fe-4S binding protein [Planctomycetota bacterium]MDP7130802.1 4Fe-4S binding protein [Planctomycetota bacterium]MDP7248718.1 4Fe-4S binding protein [Planctomycetota bacterium]
MPNEKKPDPTRREFVSSGARGLGLLTLGSMGGYLSGRSQAEETVWQIDAEKCIRCGKCATECVLEESAVKCVHNFDMCGYCKLCTGYFEPEPNALNTGAENQLCPTGAIKRKFVEDPYFQYSIEESLCVGCAKCIEGCTRFGNGSLFLQVRHDRCVNCNDCSIARSCPSQAIERVPADQPYKLKGKGEG